MHTLAPTSHVARYCPAAVTFDEMSAEGFPGGDGTVQALALVLMVLLVVAALRIVGRSLAPIMELARATVSASLAALLLLAALVLVVVMAVGVV